MSADGVRDLLPWYAAGALDAAEMRAVERELASSPDLARELAEYRALGDAARDLSEGEPAFRMEAMLGEAMRRVDALEGARHAKPSAPSPSIGERLREWLFGAWSGMPRAGRVALVAQFGIVLALGAALLVPQRSAPTYEVASGSSELAAAGPGAFTVVFRSEATEGEIRELLALHDLQIAGGPTSQGTYILAATRGAASDPQRVLAQLRESPVVRFADRIEGPGP